MKKQKMKTDVKGVDPDAVRLRTRTNEVKKEDENRKHPPKMSASDVARRERSRIYSRNGHGGYQGL